VPVHHKAQDFVIEYLEKAGFQQNAPLFQTFKKKKPTRPGNVALGALPDDPAASAG
jgi:hypothetical protein